MLYERILLQETLEGNLGLLVKYLLCKCEICCTGEIKNFVFGEMKSTHREPRFHLPSEKFHTPQAYFTHTKVGFR